MKLKNINKKSKHLNTMKTYNNIENEKERKKMNYKKILTITILAIFCLGICMSAANAATHKVTDGKYTVKLTEKEYAKLNTYETKYKTETKTRTVTKTEEVTKTKIVNVTETKTVNQSVNIYSDKYELYNNKTGKNETHTLRFNNSEYEVKMYKNAYDYELVSSDATYFAEKSCNDTSFKNTNHRITNLTSENTNFIFKHYIGNITLCFEKNITTPIYEEYKENVSYNVTEKYTVKVPYKVRKDVQITKKVGYKTVKVPVYKTKKVTGYKWEYKTVLQYKDVWSNDFAEYTVYDYNVDKYWNNGWTWYGSKTVTENGGHVFKYYSKFKKKVKYTTTKKIKTGYKTVKVPIYMSINSVNSYGKDLGKKKVLVTVWSTAGMINSKVVKI